MIPCESDKFYIVLNFTFELEPCPLIDRKLLGQVQKLVTLSLIFKVKLKRLVLIFFLNLTIKNFILKLFIDHLNVSYQLKIGDLTLIFKSKLAFKLPKFLL